MTIRIDLHGIDVALVLAMPTGIIYLNQCNGVACDQGEQEGILVPFAAPVDAPYSRILFDHFHAKPGNRGCLDSADADFIDRYLLTSWAPFCVKVDRHRLTDSFEAWVHVVAAPYSGTAPGVDTPIGLSLPMNAVLVWENSD